MSRVSDERLRIWARDPAWAEEAYNTEIQSMARELLLARNFIATIRRLADDDNMGTLVGRAELDDALAAYDATEDGK